MQVLVTDGNERPALAIVRSLGRQDIAVTVGEHQPTSLASSSKYCVRHVTYPSPYENREAFDDFLLGFVARERVDVVIPVSDVTTYSVCQNQEALGRYCAIASPPIDAFERLSDKWNLVQSAVECGIPVPRTHLVNGIEELEALVDCVQYPAVVKPVRSRIRTDRGWVPGSVHYVRSKHDLWRLYHGTGYLASYPSMIQERIVGPGVGMFVLFDRGQLVADFAHRRVREKPPAGGTSVLRESIAVDPRLRDHAIRLLAPHGWHGVAMLEYKQDQRTGNLLLIEVNGRFWGSLQLAIDAGVDFPLLSCALALGLQPEVSQPYKVGVKSRWLLGDLDHLVLRLFKSDRALHLPASAPSKLRTLVEFLKFTEPDLRYEVMGRDDPRPFLFELRQYAGALAKSAVARCSPARKPRSSDKINGFKRNRTVQAPLAKHG